VAIELSWIAPAGVFLPQPNSPGEDPAWYEILTSAPNYSDGRNVFQLLSPRSRPRSRPRISGERIGADRGRRRGQSGGALMRRRVRKKAGLAPGLPHENKNTNPQPCSDTAAQSPTDAASQTYALPSHTNERLLHFCIVNTPSPYPMLRPLPVTSSGDKRPGSVLIWISVPFSSAMHRLCPHCASTMRA
jgi:hypothetical protein